MISSPTCTHVRHYCCKVVSRIRPSGRREAQDVSFRRVRNPHCDQPRPARLASICCCYLTLSDHSRYIWSPAYLALRVLANPGQAFVVTAPLGAKRSSPLSFFYRAMSVSRSRVRDVESDRLEEARRGRGGVDLFVSPCPSRELESA